MTTTIRNTSPVRELHAEIRTHLDFIADALVGETAGLQPKVQPLAQRLEELLATHDGESPMLWAMADRLIPIPPPRRYTDSLRRIHQIVRRHASELRSELAKADAGGRPSELRHLAFALAAVVRAELEVESVVVLDVIDQLASHTFSASPEGVLLARESRHSGRARGDHSRD